ncbi:uncharacterized protein LOC120673521 [Panicum virgatum]|uniref:Uncharacterized protein n=1 Tax=Panicum virgatum TaxID=38727 RepID=A0A8T0RNZ6_PANVG|nr:uncharacterized protein LOC120673521 [Panicum virgatum]KAG2588051.1 hypothetical protein PVAP13_5NG192200 [Panicum virgatum]
MDEDAVRRVFEGSCGSFYAITAVRRCRHREERTLGFLERIKSRAEWLFGWYGAAPADVEAAADGGDLRTNLPIMPAHLAHDRVVGSLPKAELIGDLVLTSCSARLHWTGERSSQQGHPNPSPAAHCFTRARMPYRILCGMSSRRPRRELACFRCSW